MPAGVKAQRRSANLAAALAVIAAILVLATSGGLMAYAGLSMNRIAQARQTEQVQRAITRRLDRMGTDVASVAIWSDAYEATAQRFDPAWSQTNLGDYFHRYLGHDVSLLLNGQDVPLYASNQGVRISVQDLGDFGLAARPLVAQVRQQARRKLRGDPGRLGFERVGAAQGLLRANGRIYFVAASTIVPEPEYVAILAPGPEPVVISVLEVSPRYLADLGADYLLTGARLTDGKAPQGASVALGDIAGASLGAIAWTPDRPGLQVYRDGLGWILALSVATVAAIAVVILRLRKLTTDLAGARDRAEAGDRAKSEFIANVSHEIRTPLNGVLGMAQVMAGADLSDVQGQRLQIIRDSGASLLALLDDVLDLPRIEAGKLQVEDGVFDLHLLVQRVGQGFAAVADAKGIALSVSVAPDLCGAWRGDPLRIRQVLNNLVSNAVKFTDGGEVRLSVSGGEGQVVFVVADTGIGMAPASIEKLFGAFEQADSSTTRRYGGSGLGLSICRALARLMGGAIEATSAPGEGSVFTLSLPLARGEGLDEAPAAEDEESGLGDRLRILAAEDNATNQAVLRAYLEAFGVDLVVVDDGQAAVESFKAGGYDLVLMDIQMPVMNGIDATREIRAWEGRTGRPWTPILALTANVMAHQVAEYLSAGMDGHIPKPLELKALRQGLAAALAGAALAA